MTKLLLCWAISQCPRDEHSAKAFAFLLFFCVAANMEAEYQKYWEHYTPFPWGILSHLQNATSNHFQMTFASITGHPSSCPWLPSRGSGQAQVERHHGGKMSPGSATAPSDTRFPCSNESSFNHRLQLISMRIENKFSEVRLTGCSYWTSTRY